jgi:hypothetical protein
MAKKKAAKKKSPGAAPAPPVNPAPPAKVLRRASIAPPTPVKPEIAKAVEVIEAELGMPCYMFCTGHVGVDPVVYDALVDNKLSIPKQPIALIVDSPGGFAETAYRISRLLQRHCGEFTAVIPRFAKSAATLLSLGADRIILGDDADLGPLDAQFHDFDEEERQVSALDTVQAVETLEDSAVEVGMKMLRYLQENTGKRYGLLIEPSLRFAAEITKPLFEKIDSVRYTRHSRILKEAQDYAERLLRHKFNEDQAKALSLDLVQKYPAHSFVIDFEETQRIGRMKDHPGQNKCVGLHVEKPSTTKLSEALDLLRMHLAADSPVLSIGRLEDMPAPPVSP